MKHPDTYCKRANHELILRSFRGERIEAALCCKSQHPVDLQDPNALQAVKDDLNNGIKNRHCGVCWWAEQKGIESWRQMGNALEYEENRYDMEIYLDNTCDLSCVYCSNKYSSKWQQEINSVGEQDSLFIRKFLNDKLSYNENDNKVNHVERILKEVTELGKKSVYHTACQIMLLGGEPLLAPHLKKNAIDDIVEAFYRGCQPHHRLKIVIVSNGNTTDAIRERTLNTMAELRSRYPNLVFSVALSGESTDDLAEYIRNGLNWDQFIKNYKAYIGSDLDIQVGFNLTVNLLSYKETPKFVRTVFDIAAERDKQTYCQFNFCSYPLPLSIAMADPNDKHIFDEVRAILDEHEKKDTIRSAFLFVNLQKHTLKTVENFFGSENDKAQHKQTLLDYFDYISRVRGKDFSTVDPNLYNYIQNL